MAQQRIVRRLAALPAADVTGYHRLVGTDEEGTSGRRKAHLGRRVEPKIIKEHRGRTVGDAGDGLWSEFTRVVDAVRGAVEIRRGMLDRERDVPDERRILSRIGIGRGDVIAEGGDAYGDGIDIAARLEAPAEPGTVFVSNTGCEHVRAGHVPERGGPFRRLSRCPSPVIRAMASFRAAQRRHGPIAPSSTASSIFRKHVVVQHRL